MEIQVKNQQSRLKNDDVKWYLQDEELWITRYDNYAEIEESIAHSEGSFNWLYDINDTVLFDEESGKFETALINLSKKLKTKMSNCITVEGLPESMGDIYLKDKKIYSFEFPDKVIYEKQKDCLFSIKEDLKKENTVVVLITEDFGFVIENSILSGWILKNASKHICNQCRKANFLFYSLMVQISLKNYLSTKTYFYDDFSVTYPHLITPLSPSVINLWIFF